MLKKSCPWCEERISFWQLGRRRKKTITFLTVRNDLLICPYCANPVKPAGKSLYLLLMLLPFFVFPFLPAFADVKLFDLLPIENEFVIMLSGYLFILAIVIAAFGFSKFVKDKDS